MKAGRIRIGRGSGSEDEIAVHLPKLYDPSEYDARVRYAIATILRDRLTNEGGFNNASKWRSR